MQLVEKKNLLLLQCDLQAHRKIYIWFEHVYLFRLSPTIMRKIGFHHINISHLEYRYPRAHGRAIRSSSVYTEKHSTFSRGRLGAWSTPGHPLSPRAHYGRSQLREKVKSRLGYIPKSTDEKRGEVFRRISYN